MDGEEESVQKEQTIAQRLIYFFYNKMATSKDAWDIAFWQEFYVTNPDVEMDATALRSYFFNEIMCNLDHFEGLQYDVLQYLNPLFNLIRPDVLEYRDLVKGVDFVFDLNDPSASSASRAALPPIQLKSESNANAMMANRCTVPTSEEVLRYVCDGLKELVLTNDEKSSPPVLSTSECLQRVNLLTRSRIALLKCIEPGMTCYERFQRLGLLEPGEDAPVSARISDEYGKFETPQGFSTPLTTVASAEGTLVSRKDSALGHSIKETEKNSGGGSEDAGSSRTNCPPSGRLETPNYATRLRHIKTKKRRFDVA